MSIKFLLCFLGLFAAIFSVFAATYPQWWAGRGVLNTNANIVTNDFAPATLGQLKWMATKARNEFDVSMPGGNWTGIHALVDGFANSNNYAPASVGQGKYVASKFYDRLVPLGYATNYPWSSDTADDNDFAPLLIGQLKTLFDFELQAGMQGLSNRAMPSAFQVQSGYGDLYLGPDFISGNTACGQLSLGARLASLNSQDAQSGTYSGSSCELTHDDTPGFPGSSYTNFTSVWRDDDGVHVELNNASSNSGSPSNFCGSLQLYRAYFTNAVVVEASTGFTVSVSNETPERISWAGQASTNAGGHAHLLFQWKAPPIVLNPPYSLSLAGAGTNSPGAYMAVGETQPYTAHFSVAAAGTYSWTGTSHVSVSGGNSPNATVTATNASSSVGGDQVQCTFAPTGAENVCETSFPVTVISATVDIQSNYCMSCSGQTVTVTVDLKPHDVSQGSLSVDVRNADGTVIEELAKNVSAGGGTHSYTWDAASVTTGAFKVHAEWSVDSAKATNERAVNANGVWFTTNNATVAWTTNGTYDASPLLSTNSWAYDVFEWEVSPSGDASINPGTGELTFGANGGSYVVTAYAVDFSSPDFFSCSAVATVNVIRVGLIPDWNHDRVIDDDDKDEATTSDPFRFWINDDGDSGDIQEDDSDVPGKSGGLFGSANYGNSHVDGRSDLLDFFPVWLDLHDTLNLLPPSSTVQYKLKQANGAVRAVYTDLSKGSAGNFLTTEGNTYGPSFNQNSYEADTFEVTSSGVTLSTDFLDKIKSDASKGILLMEGAASTTSPLVLEVWKDGTKICETEMPLKLSGVEAFYRWVNLRASAGGGVSRATDTSEPANNPDAHCNGKHFVFVHGYSVSETGACGWNAEMFKRLYQAGSRSMFTAVTWFGNDGQVPEWLPWWLGGGSTPDYYGNVVNAFESSSNLAAAVTGLSGTKYIAGHSLGNMVVSSAIKDNGLSVNTYFMLDAAVAREAYKSNALDTATMRHPDWQNYSNRLWATEWCQLFGSGDGRNALTWRDRFQNISFAYNYYSSTEDVLENSDGSVPSIGRVQAWVNQEMRKGTTLMWLAPGNCEGGWGFNGSYTNGQGFILSPTEANALTDDNIRTNSFFGWFDEDQLYGTNGSAVAQQPAVFRQLLADGIPALSNPMGRNSLSGFGQANVDFMNYRRGVYPSGWPRSADDWRHSDIKSIAYPFNYQIFDKIADDGGLR